LAHARGPPTTRARGLGGRQRSADAAGRDHAAGHNLNPRADARDGSLQATDRVVQPPCIVVEEAEGPESGFTRPTCETPNIRYLTTVDPAATEETLLGVLNGG
jgi:hypothetical protein